MNLTIDIGNTCAKVVAFNGNDIVYHNTFSDFNTKILTKLVSELNADAGILCSVRKKPFKISSALKKRIKFFELTHATSLPVKNKYKSPKTLGYDRLANAVAASFLFPKKNCLIIDAGTCIKYDFINSEREYFGGSISPGLEMRFKALNHFTGKLPLISYSEKPNLTGKTTEEAIRSGVQIGIEGEMNEFINRYKTQYSSPEIIITGGDALRFAGQHKLSIFAAANLVNTGLNEILKYLLAK